MDDYGGYELYYYDRLIEENYKSSFTVPPGGWISVEDELPEVGTVVKCKVDYHRHGQVVISGEEIYAEYRGMNEYINKPLFDIETYDEEYADVTHWLPSKEGE